jgi:tellurite resistance protein TerC
VSGTLKGPLGSWPSDLIVWRKERRLVATPLMLALVVIETTDIVFALDSIPAVLL